jgi:hypothetical protein
MKLKDITEWSARWSTPLGTMDANAPVADGVLVDRVSLGYVGLWPLHGIRVGGDLMSPRSNGVRSAPFASNRHKAPLNCH